MSAAPDIRLPGVYFLPARQVTARGLPSLEVSAFVGFAERGPLHLPVAVEDASTYRAIFGGDLPLAREVLLPETSQSSPPGSNDGGSKQSSAGRRIINANLPSSVLAFFANGGRRCYVVRVAGEKAAPSCFHVPAIISVDGKGTVRQASISAASAGSWSKALRVGCCLQPTPLPVGNAQDPIFSVDGASRSLNWQTSSAPQAVQVGDLLQLQFQDGQQWLFPVTEIKSPVEAVEANKKAVLIAREPWRLVFGFTGDPLPGILKVSRLTSDGPMELQCSAEISSDLTIKLAGDDQIGINSGDILLLQLSDGFRYLLRVPDVKSSQGSLSPPATAIEVKAQLLLCLHQPDNAPSLPATPLVRVDRLRFDLLLREGDLQRPTLADLAFNAGHPRFWGEVIYLESSSLFRRPSAGEVPQAYPVRQHTIDLRGRKRPAQTRSANLDTTSAALAAQYFRHLKTDWRIESEQDGSIDTTALAALLAPVDEPNEDDAPVTFLPVDMPLAGQGSELVGPHKEGTDDLESFGPGSSNLFLDDHLSSSSASALMAAALDRYYVQNTRLHGLHSLMFLDEVALVCLPDAVHRGWSLGKAVEATTAAQPSLVAAEPCPPPGPFANCTGPPAVLSVDPPTGPAGGGTRVTIGGARFDLGAAPKVNFGKTPAYEVEVSSDALLRCTTPVSGVAGPVDVEVLNSIGSGIKANAFTYTQPAVGPSLPDLTPVGDFDTDTLLALQEALLKFCQARADVVGILTLPLHFDKRHCIEWQQNLREKLELPPRPGVIDGAREIADLSYVAVYHPWLLISDTSSPDRLRPVPCDGAVCGMAAARERARQVWVAPANVPVQGVLGLIPTIPSDDYADLFDLQFNLIRPEPKDFRAMSAHTLSDESSLLQLSVKRLMIQLRKAVLDRGMDFVFETNHERFREGVRVVLLDLLRFMFDRGAFSGSTPMAAYRVATDASVNTSESIEQGRFIAQIQVAPSQPMEFITVLLTRSGDGQLQLTEA